MEETGFASSGEIIPLEAARQTNGKLIHAWAIKGDFDSAKLQSNTFPLEWPPKSGRQEQFPEVAVRARLQLLPSLSPRPSSWLLSERSRCALTVAQQCHKLINA